MFAWPHTLYISPPTPSFLSLTASAKMGRMKEEEEAEQSPDGRSVVVGLRILVNANQHRKPQPYLLTKQAIKRPSSSSPPPKNYPSAHQFFSLLKTCCLCNKKLCPRHDVYMYRGDQGYCSVECRDRQIILDDMQEAEALLKRRTASAQLCSQNNHRGQPRSHLSYRKHSALIS